MILIMKKITLLAASIFLFGSGLANAAEKNNFSHERKIAVDFRNTEPIVFTERGIEFYVFADGQFDFNTRPSRDNDGYYKSNRRSNTNRTYGAPSDFRNKNYGVKVEHDNSGKVRRIGNVFINYDSNDRIKRVGSVYMTYNRYALAQVGGLQIIYNRRGQIVDIVGTVKGRGAYEYNPNNNDDNDHDDECDESSNEQDVYYYRNNDSKTKKENTKITGSVAIRVDKRS
jgi:hypothetical protein